MQFVDKPSYIPSEAYLFFPKIDNSQYPDKQRALFDGNTRFTFYEHEMIHNFKSYSAKNDYTLKSIWTDNMILRFLYANNFELAKTLSSVQEHTIWRETKLPVKVDESLLEVLNSGMLYIHGRDQEFRPIVVFKVYMIDPKKADFELIKRALTFFFEHVINEWMLPGQIENWVFIVDLKDMTPCTVALPAMKELFKYLQNNYKCRLHRLHIVNMPTCLYVTWKIIKTKFLNEVTNQKAKVYRGPVPTELLKSTNPKQLEQNYGGSAKNAIQFWPPVIPSNTYFVNSTDSKAFITEEQYMSLYQSGALIHMRVDQSRITRDSDQLSRSDSTVIVGKENMEDMNENMEDNKVRTVMREFQPTFMAYIHFNEQQNRL